MKYCPVTRTSFLKKFERSLGNPFASRVNKKYKILFKGAFIRRTDDYAPKIYLRLRSIYQKSKSKKTVMIILCRENFLALTGLKIY